MDIREQKQREAFGCRGCPCPEREFHSLIFGDTGSPVSCSEEIEKVSNPWNFRRESCWKSLCSFDREARGSTWQAWTTAVDIHGGLGYDHSDYARFPSGHRGEEQGT